jgi:hypothetical protein
VLVLLGRVMAACDAAEAIMATAAAMYFNFMCFSWMRGRLKFLGFVPAGRISGWERGSTCLAGRWHRIV